MRKRIPRRRVTARSRRTVPKPQTPEEKLLESRLAAAFFHYWKSKYTDILVPQHVFHPTRQWRFDFAIPELMVAIEVQGFGAGHNSKEGMHNDYVKHNAAVLLGWTLIYIMGMDLKDQVISSTCEGIKQILDSRRDPIYLESVRKLNGRRNDVPKNVSWNSNLDRIRRKFTETDN